MISLVFHRSLPTGLLQVWVSGWVGPWPIICMQGVARCWFALTMYIRVSTNVTSGEDRGGLIWLHINSRSENSVAGTRTANEADWANRSALASFCRDGRNFVGTPVQRMGDRHGRNLR
jgi:hypothetical protein